MRQGEQSDVRRGREGSLGVRHAVPVSLNYIYIFTYLMSADRWGTRDLSNSGAHEHVPRLMWAHRFLSAPSDPAAVSEGEREAVTST